MTREEIERALELLGRLYAESPEPVLVSGDSLAEVLRHFGDALLDAKDPERVLRVWERTWPLHQKRMLEHARRLDSIASVRGEVMTVLTKEQGLLRCECPDGP